MSAVIALVTAPDRESGEALARALVEERLAACANLLPGVTSLFRWEGAVQRETEVLLVLKTTSELAPRLTTRVPELHPYDVPEVLVISVAGGHGPYIDWIRDCVAGVGRSAEE